MKRLSPRVPVPQACRPEWRTTAGTPPAGSLVGVEHEYRVIGRDRQQVDFRALIHSLSWDGLRLDPGDLNAYRLRSGLVVTADGMEAEIASPPIPTGAGFADEVVDWAAAGKRALERALGPGYRLEGYSTHLSVALASESADDVARRYALTFGLVFARLIEGPESLGVYVRPRPNRLELCGEYLDGSRLRMAALFAVVSTQACAAGEHPPEVAARLLPGEERFGYRLHRMEAFGLDSYAATGHDTFPLATGESASLTDLAQAAVELAWSHLEGHRRDEQDALLRAVLAGPLEAPGTVDSNGQPGRPARSVFGEVLDGVQRPRFRINPEIATWGHTVFRAERGGRMAAICVEGAALGTFLAELRSGVLDAAIERALNDGNALPALGVQGQPIWPGIYGSVVDPLALLPGETPTKAGRASKGCAGRIGKVLPWAATTAETTPAGPLVRPGPARAPGKPNLPWLGVAVATVATLGILAGAFAVVAGGGGGESTGTAGTPSPGATEAQTFASPTVETQSTPAGAAGGAESTGTPVSPSETEVPTATASGSPTEGTVTTGGAGAGETAHPPAATATPTPTRPAEPTPAATPTGTPTLSPTLAPTPTPTRIVEPSPHCDSDRISDGVARHPARE